MTSPSIPFSTVHAARQSNTANAFLVESLGVAGLLFLGAQARIPLPFTPAPLTLQTLVILVAPFMMRRGHVLSGICLYLVLGLLGPHAGFSLFAAASGASYGYLAGFLAAPFILSAFPRTPRGIAAGMCLTSLCILALGAAWLQYWLDCSIVQAILLGALPFVPGDLLKSALAAAYVSRRQR